jgi:hypothetical protein
MPAAAATERVETAWTPSRSRMPAATSRNPLALGLVANGQGVDPEVRSAVEQSQQRAAERLVLTVGVEHPRAALRSLLRAWLAFHDQLVVEWLRNRPFSEAELLRAVREPGRSVAGRSSLEPETIARVNVAALRG